MIEPRIDHTDTPDPDADWHCGGWEGAERETQRITQRLTFEQKLGWL